MKVSGKTHGFMITNKDYFLSEIFNSLKSIFEQPGQLKWEADNFRQDYSNHFPTREYDQINSKHQETQSLVDSHIAPREHQFVELRFEKTQQEVSFSYMNAMLISLMLFFTHWMNISAIIKIEQDQILSKTMTLNCVESVFSCVFQFGFWINVSDFMAH